MPSIKLNWFNSLTLVLELNKPENINPVFLCSSAYLGSGVVALIPLANSVVLNLSNTLLDSKYTWLVVDSHVAMQFAYSTKLSSPWSIILPSSSLTWYVLLPSK